MANTGCRRLVLSEPRTDDLETARKVAVSASGIIDDMITARSLEEAAANSGARFLVGTTRRSRKYSKVLDITVAAPVILERSSGGGAALVFGPEDRGLTNGELALCHLAVTIPSSVELSSYNLSHAVAIVLFTLMTCPAPRVSPRPGKMADISRMEGMYGHLEELLTGIGFLLEENPDHMMHAVRGFINRAEPTESEVRAIRGVCRKLLWRMKNKV
jgi:tRNA/rRNA methyltransferase